ncbi:TPA: SMP-30/gluconolactonase/LRE family protein [Klebsiella pneumoniae]|nr:SMP-30/gluconolactonase/LRE family protein [Klebsiella pneumoniae]
MRIEVLLDLKTRLGESPVWDVEQQRLWWVDSLDGRLFACNAQGGAIKSWDVRQKIGSFALRQSGEGAVVALQNGVHLLDFASGELTLFGERVFCHVDRSEGGAADGATVDSEGYLWNALVYAGKLVRYTPEGKVDRIIEMPVKKVTSVMFGGENLDVLYVTSMAQPPLPRFPEDNQLRGSLFAIYDLGVTGVAERRFAG